MARVAVVIPAYNAERTLGAAIDSVLGQTFGDHELVVVDDGSTDGTARVARSYADRVRVIEVPNGGVSAARNRGAAESESELLAFLDADDVWEPHKLAVQVAALDAHPEAGMCFGAITRVDGDLRPIEVSAAPPYDDLCEALLLRSAIIPSSPSNMLLRRTLFDALGGFDPRFSQCADWDVLLRIGLATACVRVDEPVTRYRRWGGNMSADIGLLERDTFAVLDAFYASDPPARYRAIRRRAYSNQWLIVSGSYLHQRRWADAVRCLVRGLRADPANLARPAGLPVRWARRLAERVR